MTKLAIVLLLAATAAPAFAKDSAWMVCKGIGEHGAGKDKEKTYIVASALEHRSASGMDRDLGVTLIYGDRVLRGQILGSPKVSFMDKAAALKLANVDGKRASAFDGTASVSGDMKTFTLKGSIDFTFGDDPKAKPVPFEAKLTCETLDDNGIGH